jgi:hypothetical protein
MDDYLSWAFFLRLGVGIAIVYGAYVLLFGRRADFEIRLRGGRVECKGKIAQYAQRLLADFLLNDLALKNSIRIMGARNGPRLHLWFRGRLTTGEKQRIRNFLAPQI